MTAYPPDVFATIDAARFVLARLDEDEQTALDCIGINERVRMPEEEPPRWVPREPGPGERGGLRVADDHSPGSHAAPIVRVGHTWRTEAAHITRHDPVAVLRRVKAQREIVALVADADHPTLHADAWTIAKAAVTALAAQWPDHPDYREEWRP